MLLSIIIVSYNSSKYLKKCLDSLLAADGPADREILVVDNASSDGSPELVRKNYPAVKLIENNKNSGFAAGNNIGARAAQGTYLLFLNPDTVVEKDALVTMLDFIKGKPDAGGVGVKLYYPDGSLQLSCRHFYTIRSILMRRTFLNRIFNSHKIHVEHLMADWDHNSVRVVDWVLAACMIVPRKLFHAMNGFDENYRLYFEDVDFCYRIKQLGYSVYYYPGSVVYHDHQRDSARKFTKKTLWHIQSAIRFFRKYGWRL